jgi:hypothetical protein
LKKLPVTFIKKIEKRLKAGEREYGNESYVRPCASLVDEIEEEMLDVVGWAAIMWDRLQALKRLAKKAKL